MNKKISIRILGKEFKQKIKELISIQELLEIEAINRKDNQYHAKETLDVVVMDLNATI